MADEKPVTHDLQLPAARLRTTSTRESNSREAGSSCLLSAVSMKITQAVGYTWTAAN
jgi:hypothetical protein